MRILIVLLAIAWASPTLAAHKKHRSKDRDEMSIGGRPYKR